MDQNQNNTTDTKIEQETINNLADNLADNLATIGQRVQDLCIKKGHTVAIAESLTGGLVVSTLTNIPGSSGYVNGGATVYTNPTKMKVLNVKPETIRDYTEFSRQTSIEMAQNVRTMFDSTYGLSTTGFITPTEQCVKPSCWITICSPDHEISQLLVIDHCDRETNKKTMVRDLLLIFLRELSP